MKSSKEGFSLIEVVLSLGIAAFTLLTVVGLLPMGIKTNQTSAEETRAAAILTAVEADLRNTHPQANGGKSQCFGLVLPYALDESGRQAANRTLALNALSALYSVGLGDDETPVPYDSRPAPHYQISVIYTSVPAIGSLAPVLARVIVNWPCFGSATVAQLTSLSHVSGYVDAYVAFPAP